jgi:hemolysin III
MLYDEVMPTREIELPAYTEDQELWNCLTHAFGVVFTIIAGPYLLAKASLSGDPWQIASSLVFIASLLILYGGSAIYHGARPSQAKKVFRVLDHDNVFLLIMGTYTPFCLVALRTYSAAWCWSVYGVCLLLGVVGIALNSFNLKKFAVASFIDYLLMGWLIIVSVYPLIMTIGWMPGVFLLVFGGVLYSIGAALYAIGKTHSFWWHTVFHVFVLAGTIAMFFSIYFCVIG